MSLWQVLRQEARGAARSLRYDLTHRGEPRPQADAFTARPAARPPAQPRRRLYVTGLGVLLAGAGAGAYVGAIHGLNTMMSTTADRQPVPEPEQMIVTMPDGKPTPGGIEVISRVDPEVRIQWRTRYVTVAPPPRSARTPLPLPLPVPLPTPKPNCNCLEPPSPEPTVSVEPSVEPSASPTGPPTEASPTPPPVATTPPATEATPTQTTTTAPTTTAAPTPAPTATPTEATPTQTTAAPTTAAPTTTATPTAYGQR